MRYATIIRNPAASTAPSLEALREAASRFRDDGWTIDIIDTEKQGDARALARQTALAGSSVVFACGGDGTANEVANGLAETSCAMALIPAGLTNAFSREMGVPMESQKALAVLTTGTYRKLDVGVAGGRRFLLQAGIGFDAEVIRGVTPTEKKYLGKTAFVLRGARALLSRRAAPADLEVDGHAMEPNLYWLLLANTRSYAGVKLGDAAVAVDDGLLESYMLEGHGAAKTISSAARVLLHSTDQCENVAVEQVEMVDVKTPGLPVHADGEDLGDTPMRFGVEKQALNLLLPRDGGQGLFSAPV